MENKSTFPLVEMDGFVFMPDGSLTIKTKSKDGQIFLNRFVSKFGIIFGPNPYIDWPVMIADGGCIEFKPELAIDTNQQNNPIPNADKKAQEIINLGDVKKISAILDNDSIIEVAEKSIKKKTKKKIKKG